MWWSFTDSAYDVQLRDGKIMLVRSAFTVQELEQQIAKLPYTGERRQQTTMIEGTKLPIMAESFFRFLFEKGRIPTQDEFLNFYLVSFFTEAGNNQYAYYGKLYDVEGLRGRIMRTYPSLIRDMHFYFLAYDSQLFEDVNYSLRRDVNSGIDIEVVSHQKTYGVRLFTSTKRGQLYKNKKDSRHLYQHANEIELEIDPFNKNYRVGQFTLYRPEHLHRLKKLISS